MKFDKDITKKGDVFFETVYIYTMFQKKLVHQAHIDNLADFHNSFTGTLTATENWARKKYRKCDHGRRDGIKPVNQPHIHRLIHKVVQAGFIQVIFSW